MRTIWQDIRYGIRMLRKSPGFMAIALMTLAIGIGANTAIFSVVNAVLLRPLPFNDPERITQILTKIEDPKLSQRIGEKMQTLCLLDFDQTRKRNHVFESMAAIDPAQFVEYSQQNETRKVLGARVSAEFFPLLGVQPALGREFRPEENQPGQNQVVILGHQYWKKRYGADPGIIGQNITLKEGIHTIIGVLPTHMRFLEYGIVPPVVYFWAQESGFRDISIWKPLAPTPEKLGPGSVNSYNSAVIARLRPDTTLEQARAELDVISKQLAQEYPRGIPRSLLPASLSKQTSSEVRPLLLALFGAVAFVLLIACANVANMLLARALGRQHEIAIRVALGAGRLRLVRQFLTESLLLSLAGGFLAVLLAIGSLGLMRASLLSKMPRLSEIRPDGSVFCFTLALSVLTGILIGLAPTLRLPEPGLGGALKQGRSFHGALQRALLVPEVALTLMLLIGAGLMVKSFWRLTTVDLGFHPRNVMTVGTNYDESLKERVEQLPGVEMAAFGEPCIWAGGNTGKFDVVGREISVEGQHPEAKLVKIGSDYFNVLRIPLLMGRSFTSQDHAQAEPVAVINQTIARRYFPGQSPLDRTLRFKNSDKSFRIVGVVGDVCPNGFRSNVTPTIYLPFVQVDWFSLNNDLIVRTRGNPRPVLEAVRREFLAMNPLSPPPRVQTLEELLRGPVRPMRSNMHLVSIFAGLALILASVGIYGLTAFAVSRRTQEIGIRKALGATSFDISKSVMGKELKLVLIGTGIGLAGAFALTRIIASLLYDVSPTDPLTFAFVSLLLAAVALLASYIPARRAARIDPMEALRYE